MLVTPWKVRLLGLFSWQLLQVVETYAWLAALITGEVVILKPPVTKFDAWQPLQTDPAFDVMWLAPDVTVVAPNHIVFVVAWQLSQVRLETAAWPAAASTGVAPILNAPTAKVDPW